MIDFDAVRKWFETHVSEVTTAAGFRAFADPSPRADVSAGFAGADESVLGSVRLPSWSGDRYLYVVYPAQYGDLSRVILADDATLNQAGAYVRVATDVEESFDWTAAEADVEGLVGRQTGILTSVTSSRVRIDPDGWWLTSPDGSLGGITFTTPPTGVVWTTRRQDAFAGIQRIKLWMRSTSHSSGGRVELLTFATSSPTAHPGAQVKDITDDETRSLLIRLTRSSDGASFSALLALSDDEREDAVPADMDPETPYYWTHTNNAVVAALAAWLTDDPRTFGTFTLDFAIVENSANWRQDGENVVRNTGTGLVGHVAWRTRELQSGGTVGDLTLRLGWALERGAAIPTMFENVPESRSLLDARRQGLSWARLSVRQSDGSSVSLGDGLVRHVGVATLSLFAPRQQGTAGNLAWGSLVGNALFNAPVGLHGLRIRAPSMHHVGIGEDDVWFQSNLDIPYQIDFLNP